MDVAPELWVALWGLTVGVVLSHARGPGGGWLLWGAAAAQTAGVAVPLLVGSPALPGEGALVGGVLGMAVSGFVVGGHVWRDSPLLAGEGYWSRCVTAFFAERRLRRAHREAAATPPLQR